MLWSMIGKICLPAAVTLTEIMEHTKTSEFFSRDISLMISRVSQVPI